METVDEIILGEQTHVFIVRLWCENGAQAPGLPLWRGVIEHVATGHRHYLQDLQVIPPFISSHLGELGGAPEARSSLAEWLRRWTNH